MDREITFALLIATTATVLIGSFYFPENAAPTAAFNRAGMTYAPDDIRYPLQQAERKAMERKQRAAARRSAASEQQQDAGTQWPAPDAQNPTPEY
jgi:hypothetical protein